MKKLALIFSFLYSLAGVSQMSFNAPSGWKLTGNSGTNASNFIGTTDAVSLRMRTNNVERMIIDCVGVVTMRQGIVGTNFSMENVFSKNLTYLNNNGKDLNNGAFLQITDTSNIQLGVSSKINGQSKFGFINIDKTGSSYIAQYTNGSGVLIGVSLNDSSRVGGQPLNTNIRGGINIASNQKKTWSQNYGQAGLYLNSTSDTIAATLTGVVATGTGRNCTVSNTFYGTNLDFNGALNFGIASKGAAKVLTSDANGVATWGTIAASLGYTPENVANKATDLSTNDNTHYPTTQATQTAINNAIAGVNPAVAVQAATTTTLSAYSYNNGASGIGAFITITTPAVLIVDGYTYTAIGQRLLVKNETGGNAPYNGIYYVSTVGSGIVSTILIRALDFDQPSDMNNTGAIPVINGTSNGSTSWVMTSSVTTVGTDAVTFAQFSYSPSTLVTLTGSQTLTNKTLTSPIINSILSTNLFPNASYPSSTNTVSASGITDIYSVPKGRKAVLIDYSVVGSSTVACTATPQLKMPDGLYKGLTAGQSTSGTTAVFSIPCMVLNYPMSVAVNANSSALINIYPKIIEFDSATSPLSGFYMTAPQINNDTTIFTCPVGKNAAVVGGLGLMQQGSQGNIISGVSASNINFKYNAVPSGSSPSNNNLCKFLFNQTSSTTLTLTRASFILRSGDFFNVNFGTLGITSAWIYASFLILPN